MRYTLRLLTLDQLGRAATLICALEQERTADVTKLGEWPFEIGLWVGKAATPRLSVQRILAGRTAAAIASHMQELADSIRPTRGSAWPEECAWVQSENDYDVQTSILHRFEL